MPNTQDIKSRLAAELPRLRSDFSVSELFLFSSVARGESSTSSDIDVLVRFVDAKSVTLFTLSGLLIALEGLLGCKVDLVEDHPRLNPRFRSRIERDLLRVA